MSYKLTERRYIKGVELEMPDGSIKRHAITFSSLKDETNVHLDLVKWAVEQQKATESSNS